MSQNRKRPMSAIVTDRHNQNKQNFDELVQTTSSNRRNSLMHTENTKKQLTTRKLQETLDTIKFEKFQGQKDPFDNQENRTIWRAFGSYIAKQLINGKGVSIPKFGLFTFSATEVCLSGTTNPQLRDHQLREPVFIVGKDFVSGIERNSQILIDQELHSGIVRGDAIRPYQVKGTNGVIPIVKINYFEIGLLCNETKEVSRDHCEEMFKTLSDRVRKGEQLQKEIPFVGRFLVRTRVAGISFIEDLVKQTKGATAKQFTIGHVFASLDATHNLNMHKDQINQKNLKPAGGSQFVTHDGANWLKKNLGIDINTLSKEQQIPIFQMQSAQKPRQSFFSSKNSKLNQSIENTKLIDNFFANGPKSQHSRPSSAVVSSMSQFPVASQFQLQQCAKLILKNQTAILELVQKSNKITFREIIPSSRILKVCKKVNVDVNIVQIKQILKELGFPYNGPSCSFKSLFQAIKTYLYGLKHVPADFDSLSQISNISGTVIQPQIRSAKIDLTKQIAKIKDIFYQAQISIFQLFKQGVDRSGQFMELDGFIRILNEVSEGNFVIKDAESIFKSISKNGKMTFEQFNKNFKSETPNNLEMETKVIRQIREWMFLNNQSSEQTFDSLLRTAGKTHGGSLDRQQIHKGFKVLEIGLSAVQVDGLFTMLVSEAGGMVNLNMWLSRIYEDGDNPLQMIREIVAQHNLTQEDIMFQMKLKLWDDPLPLFKVITAIRNLDASISDSQITALFKSLKDEKDKIPVPTLIQNLTGKPFETVEFRDKIYEKLYQEIYPQKEQQFLVICQQYDKQFDGYIKAGELLDALKQTVTTVSLQDLDRFVRFLQTTQTGKILYTDFLKKVTDKVSHDPLKKLLSRLTFFLNNNKISVGQLLTKVSVNNVSVEQFTNFLKQKVDKKADINKLKNLVVKIDIDKDAYISVNDLQTSLKNFENPQFTRNQQTMKTLTTDQIQEVITKIRHAMSKRQLSFKTLFDLFDVDGNKMVSLVEFQQGLNSLINFTGPVVDQIYNLMDKHKSSLVSYEQFIEVIQGMHFESSKFKDNFDWEYSIIDQLKKWMIEKTKNTEEAFKCFDQDFDGFINKKDLRDGLIKHLRVQGKQIVDAKLDRLYKLLDTFKSGSIKLSDLQRISNKVEVSQNWKLAVIQQAGIQMSKKYSLAESFAVASKEQGKVTFENLQDFFTKLSLTKGFSLTPQLLHQLFADLDPHKKGYLSYNDWKNNFGKFNNDDQQLNELKSIVSSHFSNYQSAYKYFVSLGTKNHVIDEDAFRLAVNQLSNERFQPQQIQQLWISVCENSQLDQFSFRKTFQSLIYTGTTDNLQPKSNNQPQIWEQNVIEKIKALQKTQQMSIKEFFQEFHPNSNGQVTQLEFRNTIRKFNLGLTSKEIDQLVIRIDGNKDGLIDYNEFAEKFAIPQLENVVSVRANDKLSKLRELMILHMASPNDAFKYFDEDKEGYLSWRNFNRLVTKCYEMSHNKCPAYPVVKDMFDMIDITKDNMIDLKEWQQTFGKLTTSTSQFISVKPTPLVQWENSREFEMIASQMAKCRKHIVKCFRNQLIQADGPDQGSLFTFSQGKQALDQWLFKNFQSKYSDAQLRCVFRVGQVICESQNEPRYDYQRLLNVYKARFSGPQK